MRTSEARGRAATTPLIGPVAAPDYHVMTFNIRRSMPHLRPGHRDSWAVRAPLVTRLLQDERPTLLGVQEALPVQLDAVQSGLGSTYTGIGRGRNADGQGEQCPLFYDRSRLSLLDWEQLALSNTPTVPGSTSWGNRIPRIAVRAVFSDLRSGQEFTVINTHLDHLSKRSRLYSADTLRHLVQDTKLPGIVMGDFNVDAPSGAYDVLTEGGRLADTWRAANRQLTEQWGTFPHYGKPQRGTKRIDWILATEDFSVQRAGINVTRYGGAWPSDHAPVQAVLTPGGRPGS
ncbi:endonuclease/exonuclease/phosphatase family protein [Arthrobacter sp. 260]|uniref:endonuclease/exonuclease/phosphatase family protein n=1 Tax=Arthrobacter sp. 260 TaxID=2735314 RepID=UPI001E3FC7B6|nr:endonuclease/exonuclease/phosphatase family protein [Arthrobacter sp. 260]